MSMARMIRVILLGWALGGTLDIADALIFYGLRAKVPAERLLQNIAAGLIGKQAFAGGVKTALLGLGIHYCIALFWVALFVVLATQMRWMVRQAFLAAVAYGVVIFLVMNFLVLPHTAMHPAAPHLAWTVNLANAVLALIFCIALPVALVNRRYAGGDAGV